MILCYYILQMLFLIIFLSLTHLIYSTQAITAELGTKISTGQTNLIIQLFYGVNTSPNVTQIQNVTVYRNQTVQPEFSPNNNFVSCSNMDLYILNQTNQTGQTNSSSQYFLLLYNYIKPLNITIQTDNNQGKSYQNYNCSIDVLNISNICNISLNNSCTLATYSYNFMTVTIFDVPTNNSNTVFQFNQVCNPAQYQYFIQIQWGTVIIVVYSIFMIYVTSKFQQVRSFSNIVFYINFIPIILYCFISLIIFVLINYQVANSQEALQIFYIILSIVLGLIGIIVCCSQFLYITRIKLFRRGYYNGKLKFRVMESIGVCIGIGLFLGWWLDDNNWIISNIIFTCIFVTLIKIIKIGSLKIALIIFACNVIISLSFGNTVQIMNSTYTNYNFYAFNNPLFFLVPMITKIPNRKCAWHFMFEMAYPGLLLAYLERFDKNRSSIIYGATFIISYVLCTILWYVVNYLVPIALPFDLFTVPISMIFIILFSNRRGELSDLWSGQFYDQQKSYYENQQQILQKLTKQKAGTFNSKMFQNLRFNKDYTDDESMGSNFTQIIKKVQVDKMSQNKNGFYLSDLPKNHKKKENKKIEKQINFTDKSQQGDSKSQNNQLQSQITGEQNGGL